MKKTTKRRFGALVVGLSLVAAACGGSSDSDSTATAGGELEGMKGTMPLVNLSAEFKDGMNAFWTPQATQRWKTIHMLQKHLTQ